MSKTAGELLEQFRKLAANDRRELFDLLLREFTIVPSEARFPDKSIADVAGKYRPIPNPEASGHDAGFAEAIVTSKTDSPPV